MKRSRAAGWGLLAGLAFVTGVVVACGGGSSSSTGPSSGGGSGGSSGAVIQGQLVRSQSTALKESTVTVVLRTALGIGLAEAAAGDPVVGATVRLMDGGTIVQTTTTGSQGNFIFTDVPAGTYTIQVELGGVTLIQDATSTTPIPVGPGDTAIISGQVTDSTVAPQVHVVANDLGHPLQNDAQRCHAVSIATASGASVEDVIAARQGKGWGPVAMQFGVSPKVLGNNNCHETETADASAASNGKAKGKGKGKGKGQL